jgi:thiol-disulfide isomerase/thioredoxin
VSPGLIVAVALAAVVLSIATVVAFRSDQDTTEKLRAGATLPPSPLAPSELDAGQELVGESMPPLDYTRFGGGTAPLTTGGRPLVVNFWATYCGPCVTEMPAIEQVYQANADRVGVLGLQVQEAEELAQPLIDRTGVTYPLGRDPQGTLVRAFGGMNLPTTVLITADGTIAEVHTGAVTAEELQALIDEHLPA